MVLRHNLLSTSVRFHKPAGLRRHACCRYMPILLEIASHRRFTIKARYEVGEPNGV